ncbi:TMEM175 family protein [Cupriavidus sp. IDO]|uniref:TMEM175 family protein n=1 Tax=Cupriavidus sp. IDO TaxID=1539142 RepID=UPI00057963DE|nr:TMEM175 family protein [Cupriavidus sp. IDO]KWR89082.1 hypothetical protein RM96_16605 [Cupriavidus sp. IDO]
MGISKNRLESFSDGVISVSLTLMLFQLQVPEGLSFKDILNNAYVFFGYVLSFVYVGIYWNNHHHLFQVARGINGKIMWANLHLLFWLSMIPFTTTWTGRSGFAETPTAMYAFVLFMCAVSYSLLTRLIMNYDGEHSALRQAIGNDLKGKLSLPIYALAILASFFSSVASLLILTLMAGVWFFPDSRIEKYLLGSKSQEL